FGRRAIAPLIEADQAHMDECAFRQSTGKRRDQQHPRQGKQSAQFSQPRPLIAIAHEKIERVAVNQHAIEIKQHRARCDHGHVRRCRLKAGFPCTHTCYVVANRRFNSAPGSLARMKASPTRNALMPASRSVATSSGVWMPDSLTRMRSYSISCCS